jgi:hypothetical protein
LFSAQAGHFHKIDFAKIDFDVALFVSSLVVLPLRWKSIGEWQH